jgi:hypothetical protein
LRLGGSISFTSRPLNVHRRAQGVTARTRGEIQLAEIRSIYAFYDTALPTTEMLRLRREAYLQELALQFDQAI